MKPRQRLPLLDALKALASQLIVLHHLAFYGPMSDAAYPIASGAIDWLYDFGRMAVQVFLVCGGFLAARSLLGEAGARSPAVSLQLVWSRYKRLALPLFAALAICVLVSALVRPLLDHPSVPAAPALAQILAHTVLLQQILGQDSLSAGVWYVAIDFQLFALFVGVLWLTRAEGLKNLRPWLLVALACASLLYFNGREEWDNWASYFFGAYALGLFASFCSQGDRRSRWFVLLFAVAIAALCIDFRARIAVAVVTALILAVGARSELLYRWPQSGVLAWLGKISYSLFLIHFPVCLLVNTALTLLAPENPVANLAGMLLAWGCSIGAAALFHRYVEARVGKSRRPATQATVSAT